MRTVKALVFALALALGAFVVADAQCQGGVCVEPGSSGGVPTIGTSFTTDIVSTKADAHFIMIPPTASDTPFAAGLCDDAGSDDDDFYQISTTSTPCATATTNLRVTATSPIAGSGSLTFQPRPDATGTFLRVFNRGAGDIAFEANAGGQSAVLDFRVPSNGTVADPCLNFTLQSSVRWGFSCANFGLAPQADNAYDIGTDTNRVRTLKIGTGLNAGLTAAAATIRPQVPTSVGNVGANSCGTTAATLTGTNTAGKVTVGATSGTQCRITFSSAWTNAPSCVANNNTTANIVRVVSTTTTVDLIGTFVAADVLSYQCLGF